MAKMDQLENTFCHCHTHEGLYAKEVFERRLRCTGSYKRQSPGVRMAPILRLNLSCARLSRGELVEPRKKTVQRLTPKIALCVARQIFRHEVRARKFGPSIVY